MSAYNTFGSDAIGDYDPDGKLADADAEADEQQVEQPLKWTDLVSNDDAERKARPEDGLDYAFNKAMAKPIPVNRRKRR